MKCESLFNLEGEWFLQISPFRNVSHQMFSRCDDFEVEQNSLSLSVLLYANDVTLPSQLTYGMETAPNLTGATADWRAATVSSRSVR